MVGSVEQYLNSDAEVTGCDADGLARVAEAYGRPLPDDYVELLTRYGGYNDTLLRADGTPVMAWQILDAEWVPSYSEYAVVEETGGIAVAGINSYRVVLMPDGDGHRYVTVDLGSGIEDEFGSSFVEVLEAIIARMDHVPAEPYGDPVEHDVPVPTDAVSLLDAGAMIPGVTEEALADAEAQLGVTLPSDLCAFYRLTDGYLGPLRVPPFTRVIDVSIMPLAELVAEQQTSPEVREIWPSAVVVGGRDGSFPLVVDTDTGVWFTPFIRYGNLGAPDTAAPFVRLGDSLAGMLVAYRARMGE